MSAFNDILTGSVGDAVRPKLLPQGTYYVTIPKVPTHEQRGDWTSLNVQLKVEGPHESMDEETFAEFGDPVGETIIHNFLFGEDEKQNERTKFQLRRFLEDHLQIAGAQDMTFSEAIAQSPGHRCLVTVTHRPDKNDPEVLFLNVKNTAPAE